MTGVFPLTDNTEQLLLVEAIFDLCVLVNKKWWWEKTQPLS